MVVVPPSGLVTFLFTDVEGSTRRWESDPGGMRVALAVHDEVLRWAVESHGGWVFKHTGDGVCAAFASPVAAVDAAVDAQRRLDLPVRMGIATGEVERRGDDFFGPALNRAARVMAAGHGGQILLAGSTAALVDGVDLVDLGARLLRDLSQPVHVFQVRADGLRDRFPELVTIESTPGNLRAQSTSFIGRDRDVADIVEELAVHRLVTLTGVGGVGKTRLALQVAGHLAPGFVDGVWVIELAPVTDPAAVADAVAAALGVVQQPGQSVGESVAATLAGRERLLVFDNCEHVLDAAAMLVESILARSSTVKVLATSREGLGVGDERLWPVPSLPVDGGFDSDGVRLFVDRARALVRGFDPVEVGDRDAVVEICARLDGVPLAIELAASRMVSMTSIDVRDRLDDRFRLLSGSRRGLERHQTLRHAVAWSFDLLNDDERALLCRCAVFADGFDLAAAVAVADGSDQYVVLDLLDSLVRKSLLIADRSGGHGRFSMLETIRQFAEEHLATDILERVRDAHARHFADSATAVLEVWNSPRQRDAYLWLEVERDNLRTAFRWAIDHDDIDRASTIAVSCALVGWFARVLEPIGWVEDALGPARACGHRRLAALTVLACLCSFVGRLDDALRHSDDAVALIDDESYDRPPFGLARFWVGVPHIYVGHPEVFVELNRMEIERTGDPLGICRAGAMMGLVLSGRFDEAMAMAGEVVTTAEAAANPASLAYALWSCGVVFRSVDPLRAMNSLRRGLLVARDSGNRQLGLVCATFLADVEVQYGDPDAAWDLFTGSIGGYHDAGDFESARPPLASLAVFLGRIGRFEPAAVIAGYATNAMTKNAIPELASTTGHLGSVLGGETFESLLAQGRAMEPATAVRYALDEIERARRQS